SDAERPPRPPYLDQPSPKTTSGPPPPPPLSLYRGDGYLGDNRSPEPLQRPSLWASNYGDPKPGAGGGGGGGGGGGAQSEAGSTRPTTRHSAVSSSFGGGSELAFTRSPSYAAGLLSMAPSTSASSTPGGYM